MCVRVGVRVCVCVCETLPVCWLCRSIIPHVLFSSDEVLSLLPIWAWLVDIRKTFLDLKKGLHAR